MTANGFQEFSGHRLRPSIEVRDWLIENLKDPLLDNYEGWVEVQLCNGDVKHEETAFFLILPVEAMASDHHEGCACFSHESLVPHSVQQTVDEMTFERGIWSAAVDGDLDHVKKFLQKGTDPSVPDRSGYTALHYASRNGHYAICEYLLKNGANSNAQTNGGASPLHRAAYCGHHKVVVLLLHHGADPVMMDDDGATPLHKAAERGHLNVCQILLEQCPTLKNATDKRKRKPADLVLGNPMLMELLKTC
ncbi:ankyrin repeat domain-containing protein 39 isoform X2 [Protopterus annectens]|uniref:ankyrin repeat domain-containing protein 39 isoform X2 n=1 Tax=Protopterus annectens TaxID=7888 RepID=UPI001CF99E34|nr:ankyrin repeat domain-containing protein 39 isoform X2 [Protopterus annectens]